jgi:YHS domain-containing protein
MAKDPVCGMEVDERRVEFRWNYRGKTCYFSSVVHVRGFKRSQKRLKG